MRFAEAWAADGQGEDVGGKASLLVWDAEY
jgi:hypothetical protein